jgi:hypothetical protein
MIVIQASSKIFSLSLFIILILALNSLASIRLLQNYSCRAIFLALPTTYLSLYILKHKPIVLVQDLFKRIYLLILTCLKLSYNDLQTRTNLLKNTASTLDCQSKNTLLPKD